MRFDLFGAATAQRGNTPDVDGAAGFRDDIDYVIEAEALGFEGGFIVEHHFTGFGQVSATLNLLGWIGARTSTMRLGTAVIVLPWHNPALLAEQAATVDLLSGGRLDFGVGRGYRHNEFASFGIPIAEAEPRFDEAVDLITRAWTSDERFDFHGRYWQFSDIVVEPPTAQKPHPRSTAALPPNTSSIMAFSDTREASSESALYGSPEEICRKIERLGDAGVDYILLNGGGTSRENLRRFAREVMPHFPATSPRQQVAE